MLLLPLASLSCFWQSDACPTSSRPAVPTLLEVTQNPDTLVVTAKVVDQSDNEQWFALERTFVTKNNRVVVVGTDKPSPDRKTLPLNREIGDTVIIDDRGIFEGQKPTPGLEYSYTVRAWNCYAQSPPSNEIIITSLFPR